LLEALRSTPSFEGIAAGKIDQPFPNELQVAEHAARGWAKYFFERVPTGF
jgi:hypothetical protein